MKIFKTKIPNGEQQEINEIESWTVRWKINARGYEVSVYSKVFINKDEAYLFDRRLNESAKFIRAYIETEVFKN